jgi:hypothetical protein
MLGFMPLFDQDWHAIDSPEGWAEQAAIVWDALEVGRRDEVKDLLPALVSHAIALLESRFPDDIDRRCTSVSEWVMRDRPQLATLECRFCRNVLDELRRARKTGFSIDAEPWTVEQDASHSEKCAIGVLAGLVKPIRVSQTVVRSRAQLAKLPMRFELDTYRGNVDANTDVTVFGEGFTSCRVEVWFGEARARILKRVSDRELVVVDPYNHPGSVPVRVKIDGRTTVLRNHFHYSHSMY